MKNNQNNKKIPKRNNSLHTSIIDAKSSIDTTIPDNDNNLEILQNQEILLQQQQREEELYKQSLLKELQGLDIRYESGNTQDYPFEDLLSHLKAIKEIRKKQKHDALILKKKSKFVYHPPQGNENIHQGIKSCIHSNSMTSLELLRVINEQKEKNDFTIQRFRTNSPKWNKSIKLGNELEKIVYRIPG